MANPWFRMYSEFATDPKVQMLTEALQRRLLMIMCMRCSEQLEGRTNEEIAFVLRIDAVAIEETKEVFQKKGFIDSEWRVLNWEKRQFVADSSLSRVQKYRANRKAMGLSSNGYTKHSVTVTSRDGHACVYCGSGENLCIDHVLPTCKGGDDSIENLATSCKACNSGKAGRTPAEAGYTFINKLTEKLWLQWMKSRTVTVTETSPEQNRTDTEEVSKDTLSPKGSATVPNCPHVELIDLYEKHLPELPGVKSELWGGARAASMRQRWVWVMTAKKRSGERYAETKAEAIDWFDRFFGHVAKSDFLTGRTGKWSACDLGWLMKEENFAKVTQGNYDNKASA